MKNYSKTVTAIILIVVVLVIFLSLYRPKTPANQNPGQVLSTSSVTFACNEGKTIDAVFHSDLTPSTETTQATNTPPTPTGTVDLVLSDGRSMSLHQTISADGIRYANPDESFVFWNKGNGALVLENNQEKSFIGCVSVKPETGDLSQIYQDGKNGISIRYPQDFAADKSYVYQNLGPGEDIYGVKFTIPTTTSKGTNLSPDTYVSVEMLPKTTMCTANLFLGDKVKTVTLTDGDTIYSLASTTGAGAGNRYEETVYAIPGTNPCVAVRYFIHYGVIQNYPEGAVKEFDKQAFLNQFDQIRRTLTVNQ